MCVCVDYLSFVEFTGPHCVQDQKAWDNESSNMTNNLCVAVREDLGFCRQKTHVLLYCQNILLNDIHFLVPMINLIFNA